jgi:hypothetical protein
MKTRMSAFVSLAVSLCVLVGCSGSSSSSKPIAGTGQGPKAKTDDGKARGAAKDVLPLPGK